MAEVTLKFPAQGLTAPTSWGSRDSIKKMIERIYKDYGTFIDFASKESKLPKEMIASFIAVESGGNPKAGASGHITQGLMQWNRNFTKATLEREKKDGRIYTAKIPESEKFLDFHADFDEQTDYVKKALISMPKKYKIELSEGEYQENLESINEDIDEYDFKIGDDDYWELINYVLEPHILFKQNYIYDWIKDILFEGYEYETSEFLYKLGIKGVKHSAFGNVNYSGIMIIIIFLSIFLVQKS
jgi:hypothetical protein